MSVLLSHKLCSEVVTTQAVRVMVPPEEAAPAKLAAAAAVAGEEEVEDEVVAVGVVAEVVVGDGTGSNVDSICKARGSSMVRTRENRLPLFSVREAASRIGELCTMYEDNTNRESLLSDDHYRDVRESASSFSAMDIERVRMTGNRTCADR